jgi:hypothetical protein
LGDNSDIVNGKMSTLIHILTLIDTGAIIQETEDKLMWIGGDLSGVPSLKISIEYSYLKKFGES